MPVYEFAQDRILPLSKTTFSQVQFQERRDLQRLLRENVGVIAPDTLVIAEEFGDWTDSRRRIDLLGVDADANLVVIELKRTEDGGHMELQALRYAAMVSTMTFDQAVDAYARYLTQIGKPDLDARAELLDFLSWEEPDHDLFGQDVKIVLASAEFSRELTTTVLWMNKVSDLDIRCIRLQPYSFDGRVLVNVEQIIPLPEAEEYQVEVREKARKEREARARNADYTRYDVKIGVRQFQAETKRRALYVVFRHLFDSGINLDELKTHLGKKANRALYVVEGEVNHDELLLRAEEIALAGGRKFRPARYFCSDEELFHYGGNTYVFSNQWGGSGWLNAISALSEAYPAHAISFAPVTGD